MDEVTGAVSAIADAVSAVYSEMDAAGYGWVAWVLVYAAALALGVRHVRWHMQRSQVSIAGQVVGMTSGTDRWGASLFRSAESVRRRPSLSPLYGKPAIWRGVPYPLAATALWLWVEHRLLFWLAASTSGAYTARRVRRWAIDYRHRRELVRPLARALAPLYGQDAETVLEGIVLPRQLDDKAEIVIPLPDHYLPSLPGEVSRILHDRVPGEWRSQKSQAAPYVLRFTRRPSPPGYVSVQDVAELVLRNDTPKQILLGLGCEGEPVWGSLGKDAPHMALSCGTQGGKSTLNRWLLVQFALQGTRQICIDVKYTSFKGCESIPGVHIYNDPERLDLMWAAIHLVAEERRRRARTRQWDHAIKLYLEEQNMFAAMVNRWWERITSTGELDQIREMNPIIDKIMTGYGDHAPKVCPVWDDVNDVLFMGGEFEVHLISTYQRMTAAAAGGGKAADGGAMRDQYGVKMLANFSRAAWESVVQTRPIPDAPSVRGRWIQARMRGGNREIQVPNCREEDPAWLLAQAGVELSPHPVPDPIAAASHEIDRLAGDARDGDTGAVVLPFRARQESPWQASDRAQQQILQQPQEVAAPKRYTLEEAYEAGIIPLSPQTAKKRRTRARQRGEWFPPAEKRGNAETYTAEDLRKFYGSPDASSPEEQAH